MNGTVAVIGALVVLCVVAGYLGLSGGKYRG